MIQNDDELAKAINLTLEQKLSQRVLSLNMEHMSRDQLKECLTEIYEVSLRRGNFCDVLANDRAELVTAWEATTIELAKALQLINQQTSFLQILEARANLYRSLYDSTVGGVLSDSIMADAIAQLMETLIKDV